MKKLKLAKAIKVTFKETKNLVRLMTVFFILFAFKAEAQNNALNFDGYSDYNPSGSQNKVVCGNSIGNFGTSDFTIEFNIKTTSTDSNAEWLLTKRSVCGHASFFNIGITNGFVYLEIDQDNNGTNHNDLASTTAVNDGTWHHVALVRSGTSLTFYIDGIVSGSKTDSFITSVSNSDNLTIGGFGSTCSSNQNYVGSLDEVRIWNVARTQSQIQASKNTELVGNEIGLITYYNFNQGTANGSNNNVTTLLDKTVNANNGTLNNFALTGTISNWVGGNAPVVGTTPIFNPSMAIQPFGDVDSPGNEQYFNIIDGNIGSKFLDFMSYDGFGITVDLGGDSAIANSIAITTANDASGRDPQNYEVLGSNDGVNFTSIATGNISCIDDRYFERSFSFSNSNSYKYYTVNFTNQCGDSMFQLAEVQLYGSVTTSPKPVMRPSYCGTVLPKFNSQIPFTFFANAQQYMFEVSLGGFVVGTFTANKYNFDFTKIQNTNYGTTYTVRAKVKINGVWGGYGASCDISTPAAASNTIPTTKVKSTICGTTLATISSKIAANPVYNAEGYRFEITSNGTTVEYNSPVYNFKLSQTGATVAFNTVYLIRVAAKVNGVYGEYGAFCDVTTPGNASTSRAIVEDTDFSLIAYPNPSYSDFKLQVNGASDEAVSILVFDMTGRQIENKEVSASDVENITIGQNYSAGIYNVIVSQGENTKTVRLVKN